MRHPDHSGGMSLVHSALLVGWLTFRFRRIDILFLAPREAVRCGQQSRCDGRAGRMLWSVGHEKSPIGRCASDGVLQELIPRSR